MDACRLLAHDKHRREVGLQVVEVDECRGSAIPLLHFPPSQDGVVSQPQSGFSIHLRGIARHGSRLGRTPWRGAAECADSS